MRKRFTQLNTQLIGFVLMLSLVPFAPGQAYFAAEQGGTATFFAGELAATLESAESTASLGPQQLIFTSDFELEHSAESVASEVSLRTETVGSGVFCDALRLRITRGTDITVAQATTFTFGPEAGTSSTQLFTADISVLESDLTTFPHGAGCNLTLISESVQTGLVVDEGFTDVQRITWSLLAQQVVLNEVLADAGPGGDEFIELFNTGSEPVDVAGWEITELTGGGATTSHLIVATSTNSGDLIAFDDSGSTVVPAGGYLALKFAGAASYLNNDGDTVTLFNHLGTEQDLYAYSTSLPGKSDARIPDGTGDWVDPIPTPGLPNKLEMTIQELSIGLAPATTSLEVASSSKESESSAGGSPNKAVLVVSVSASSSTSTVSDPAPATTTPTTTTSVSASSTETSVVSSTSTEPIVTSATASSSEEVLKPEESAETDEHESVASSTTSITQQVEPELPTEEESAPNGITPEQEPKEEEATVEVAESEPEKEPEPEPIEVEVEKTKEEEVTEPESA